MAKDKKSFLIYCDIIHTIDHLTDAEKGRLFQHLLEYVNDLNPVLEDRVLLGAWKPIQQFLKRDLKKYENICSRNKENGKKGGRPSKERKPKKPSGLIGNPKNPSKPKKADSDSDIDIKEKNIKKRKAEFKKLLAKYKDVYVLEMIKDFFEYWTEHGVNDKKMRFEKQTSFDVGRRLKTWQKRSKNTYSGKNYIPPTYGN